MHKESILILNDIEKRLANEVVQKLTAGELPAKGQDAESSDAHRFTYEYSCLKQEKIIRGVILGCPYRLRYIDYSRIFFSARDCKDVCGMFYDMVAIVYTLASRHIHIAEVYRPFEVDLHTENYVFFTGAAAASIARLAEYIRTDIRKMLYSSQYVFSVSEDPDAGGVYGALIQQFKANGYSNIYVLQVWIRGEILYYAIADGAVLRPEYQRSLSGTEEEDIIRKTDKTTHRKFMPVDVKKASRS
ncbi:MAG: hypothetical protein LBT33_07145 [Spirochaetia bacterium]|jgi:hypothetical protein|nr:hypothetical protein [Spirochaetia bacterium]